MERIVIYGLGQLGMFYIPYLTKTFHVMGYSDRVVSSIDKYIKPCDICKVQFDYLVVTSVKYYEEIKEELVVKYQIAPDRIIAIDDFLAKIYGLQNNVARGTSITDDGIYPSFCHKAANSEYIFNTFRLNPIIRRIYEHVTRENGQLIVDMINSNSAMCFSVEDWYKFAENDKFGMPEKFEYNMNGIVLNIAPTTLRYIKILQEILMLYNTDNISTIAEIGIGYAGQCRIIMSYLQNREYFLFDLPEVLELADVYMNKFPIQGKINYVDGTHDISCRQYDLVISNYAFSELNREVQDFYLERVINNSNAGYMIWNSLSFMGTGRGYSVEELLNKIDGSYVLEEKPLTAHGNCVIVWDRAK